MQLVWLLITTLHIKFLLLLNQNLLPHIPKINLCLVIHLACPVNPTHPNPILLVKPKVNIPYGDEAKPTGLTTLSPRPQSSIKTNTIDIVTKPKSDSIMEIFELFMLNGFVSLSGDNCPPTPIKILRDTGASQSLILADILPFSEKTSSGTSVLIQGVECGTVNIPLHHVNLSSDLVTGLVVIGITPSLPFKGVHLLLGNDLAGDKVVVNPFVTDTPNIGQTDDPIEQEIPDLYPSCAVTRAMAKRAILKNSNSDIDLTDTFIGQYFNNEIKKSLDLSLSDTQTDSSITCHSPPRSNDQGHDTLSKSQLIQEQQSDPEISKLIFKFYLKMKFHRSQCVTI